MSTITDHPLAAPLLSAVSIAVSVIASTHVLLSKRDTRAAIGWIGLIWLSPFLGTMVYVLLGINRITRKARSLRLERPHASSPPPRPSAVDQLPDALGPGAGHLGALATLVGRASGLPLLAGNHLTPLHGGDEAYPAMLEAIRGARRNIALSTYIFNDDLAGRVFLDALKQAHDRGVVVRVLVDDVGCRYDLPTIMGPLRSAGIPSATFMPTLKPGWFPYFNLRTHRKILVVDGEVGFTGGLNIDKDYQLSLGTRNPKTDMHFRVRGPVVGHLMYTFADDWAFTTYELLEGDDWFPAIEPAGEVFARGVESGPDCDPDEIQLAILGALSVARSEVLIVTPYFVPDATLISALVVAAMRGVDVNLLLPDENNLMLVQWASNCLLPPLLEGGCRVWSSPPPFDHAKLMIVDEAWSFVGSANWDARSFRLNFEFNLEAYDRELAREIAARVRAQIRRSRPVTLEALNARSLPIKIRDNIARLFSPYL